MTATPLPLSLMPGPSRTESRCAPTIATRRPAPGRSAITLRVRSFSATVSTTSSASPLSVSAALPADTEGMSRPGRISEPRGGASLAPSATTSPPAPPDSALRAFSRNVQRPRAATAILSRAPAKSAARQPSPTIATGARTRPGPE